MAEQLPSKPENNNQSKSELKILSDYLKRTEVVCDLTREAIDRWIEDRYDVSRDKLNNLIGRTLTLSGLNLGIHKALANYPFKNMIYTTLLSTFLDKDDVIKIEDYNLAIAQQNKNNS
jgi:hypothetical protein